MSELDFHRVTHSCGLLPHPRKQFGKLLNLFLRKAQAGNTHMYERNK